MLNSADNNSFADLVSVYLKVFDHYTWKFKYFGGIQQVLNSDFLKFRILEILNLHQCISPHLYFYECVIIMCFDTSKVILY